ncbi:MAG: gliding motility lipoprotein GldH [Chitinophagales bacterium]|nr:gliding motility lipoprotein GldH [Chitinophagales bacterium]MBP8754532.1 gliding motility lipoprotein GldH [Chitinophagales bacterium]MBP9795026.1 gliding motility lipoprotein GldH [Chitinophagales bacterium]HET8963199.1 gliding motility lipoprotein GldH [Chitinophagales bacterium]
MRNFLTAYVILLLFACDTSRVYDKNEQILNAKWLYDQPLSFSITIQDTTESYNMFINVRHSDMYAYNNLLMQMQTIFPDSTIQNDNIEVVLSETSGEWTGNCIDNVCYNSILIRSAFTFPEPGNYTFILTQNMRINPITEIMDVGVKIEKFGVD